MIELATRTLLPKLKVDKDWPYSFLSVSRVQLYFHSIKLYILLQQSYQFVYKSLLILSHDLSL